MKFLEKLFLKNLRKTSYILLYFFIAIALLIFLVHNLTVLIFQYPLDYGEGPLLDQALRVVQGKPLYPINLDQAPYVITNYPPIFILLNAFFVWIFGPSLLIGRLISFISTVLSAIFIGLIVGVVGNRKSKLPALAAASIFLIIPYVLEWASLFRIDMLGLMFTLCGLFLVIRYPKSKKAVIISTIIFIMAAFTRQSFGFAAPLAASIWLFTRDKRQLPLLILMYSLGGLILFGLINWLTKGGFFFHIITANVNPFNWQTVTNFVRDIWFKMPVLVILSLIFLVLGWKYTQTYPFLAPYLIAGSIASLTIGKIGSNVNYLVELSAGFSLLAGVCVDQLSNLFAIKDEDLPDFSFRQDKIPAPETIEPQVRRKMWLNVSIFLILAISLTIQIAGLTRNSLYGPIINRRDRFKQANGYAFVNERIKATADQGPILADEFMAMLPANQLPLYLQPFEMTQLANAGIWDQSGFLQDIEQHKFPLILIHHFEFFPVYLERWTPEMLTSIFDQYVATDRKANTILFTPKDKSAFVYPEQSMCPDVPWRIPSHAEMGVLWYNGQLFLMGRGWSGEVPVYAIADGLLYHFPGWNSSVAIQHENPFAPGKYIWSFYGDMATAFDETGHHIVDKFIGAEGIRVAAGELIGYQGTWLGSSQQTWSHVRFTLLPANEDGSFPNVFIPIDDFFANIPASSERERLGLGTTPSLSVYTGLPESNLFGTFDFLPLICSGEEVKDER